MSSEPLADDPSGDGPSLPASLGLYLGYLAIFFTTWVVNKVDYLHIGQSAETTRLWYACPTLFGSAFLIVALTVKRWWRPVFFDATKAGPKWLWVLPATMALLILNNFAQLNTSKLTPDLVLWSALGGLGVGLGEEVITRGGLLVGFRSRFSERQAWLFSTLLFSALHIPNVFFGLPLLTMPFQLTLTFILGSGLYIVRRLSGTLITAILLHGLWDSSLFLGQATGGLPSLAQMVVYPLVLVCLVAFKFPSPKLPRAQRGDTEFLTEGVEDSLSPFSGPGIS